MFYDVYCELCRKNGLTPSGAAMKIGFNRASVTMWKTTGKAPKQDLLIKIADFFGVTTDYLLGNENTPTEDGERKDVLDDVDVAFYGDYRELSEDDKATIRDRVRIMRERRAKKQEQ